MVKTAKSNLNSVHEDLPLLNESTTNNYSLYTDKSNVISSCSLSARAAKGSVASAKDSYSAKEDELFRMYLELK